MFKLWDLGHQPGAVSEQLFLSAFSHRGWLPEAS